MGTLRAPMANGLYVRFYEVTDDHTQSTEIKLDFSYELLGDNDVDVTFLLGKEEFPSAHEGILLTAHGGILRLAKEDEFVDRWPGDGDWFWTWEELAEEWKNSDRSAITIESRRM
jgi:hypothetical protein